MISPLSSRPFHTIRWKAQNLADNVTSLFLHWPKQSTGHLISLYKRKEGAAVFDPNYGMLFFTDYEKLDTFINNAKNRLFNNKETTSTLYICLEKSK